MLKNLKLSSKMAVIGILATVALTVLYGVVFVSNRMASKNVAMEKLRAQQLDVLSKMRMNQKDLLLAAMDSIIDKDEGEVASERMEVINTSSAFLVDKLPALHEAADTAEEKQLAQSMEAGINAIVKGIKEDLVNLITNSGAEVTRIEQDFVQIDDILDEHGGAVGNNLTLLEEALNQSLSQVANAREIGRLSASVSLHLIQVQQWLTDISATRGAEGYDDGYEEAEKHALGFRKDLTDLLQIEPTLAKYVEGLTASFDAFYAKGKWMADQYIKGGSEAGNKAMDEFDGFAADINTKIQTLSIQADQDLATWQKLFSGLVLTQQMDKEFLNLMLAAMDSIIDKGDGKIAEERQAGIDQSLAFLNSNVAKLEDLAETAADKDAVSAIRSGLSQLEKGITTDLVHLIENSAVKLAQIEQAFVSIDDVLDEYADATDAKLARFESSVQAELDEASATMVSGLSTAGFTALAGYLSCGGLLITCLVLVTLSIVRPIKRIVLNLTEGSEQVSSASGQVSSASQSLAEGATEQAAGLEETSSSLEEMSSMTKQNADNAQQANSLASQARKAADNGAESMTRMNAAIQEIQKSSDETAKIIKVIDEIAFQTNLLALNAAVEAARAGEAGKGFAVVAEEVRNLAMRSAEAAKNTASMIEESVKNSNNGVDIATEVSKVLDEIVGSIGKTTDLVGEIAAASQEQAQGIDQVNTSVAQMDKVTQQNAANAEESASASEELSAQAAQMNTVVEELSAIVGSMNNSKQTHKGLRPGKNQARQSDHVLHQIAGSPSQASPQLQPTRQQANATIPLDDDMRGFNA